MSSSTLTSVSNAVRVLKAFSSTDREWGVSDLARRLGLGKSTVHRLLTTLTTEGMLEQDQESGRYRLGLAVFDLAAAVPTQLDLHEAVLSPMTDLRNQTGETVQVAVLDGREVVYVERLDSPHTLRMFLEIGRRNSAHCAGTGKALLAFIPRVELERLLAGWELEARTEHTITSVEQLRAELEQIR
ncbi:MAG: IclR family transcriptional regulator, partial [Acidimicrobiia bacterium]|nr:IclR family transcriptional regulator [Acidimicrobiia bacterium]